MDHEIHAYRQTTIFCALNLSYYFCNLIHRFRGMNHNKKFKSCDKNDLINSEAATETVFENICSFFPGATFLKFSRRVHLFLEQTWIFQEGLLCSSNRHEFFRRAYRKDMFFQGEPPWKNVGLFVEQTLLSHRTDTNFPRNPYLVLEHIRIFQEPLFLIEQILIFQEALSSPRTHTIFQETPCLEHIGIFQVGTPSRKLKYITSHHITSHHARYSWLLITRTVTGPIWKFQLLSRRWRVILPKWLVKEPQASVNLSKFRGNEYYLESTVSLLKSRKKIKIRQIDRAR